MTINEIVDLSITEEAVTVQRTSFGIPCIVGPNASFSERLQYFTDLASIASALTNGTSDPEYQAASDIFAQNPRVNSIAIGRIDSGDANITDSLNEINTYQSDWYGFIITDRTVANQVLAAAWAEANKKFAVFGSADANIIDTTDVADSTTIAAQLKANSYTKSAAFYQSDAATKYADGGLIGKILPLDPGSYTAMFKTIIGTSVDTFTATQSKNALDKNCNIYQLIGNRNMLRSGTTGKTGRFIDTSIFIDWLEAEIQSKVFGALSAPLKVPYDEGGIAAIDSKLQEALQNGQNRGGISPTVFDENGIQVGGFYTEPPIFTNIPAADKVSRILQNYKFTAYLAGAIHTVKINGVVTA